MTTNLTLLNSMLEFWENAFKEGKYPISAGYVNGVATYATRYSTVKPKNKIKELKVRIAEITN